ncbi:hypothetical protein PHMEG_0006807 [Phytophthora megakarya]|uniref:Uncharacterized protein n=1 Tax=Phytophthora megakarya TaxID=4795 RepID=A0A225WMZ6_9STRA|nr:hypothetical protein PHMEG_0006807 [Phytophthora megakarya]
MRQLYTQFPEWLDLNREVESTTPDSPSQRQARFCSWGDFHLHTIGASALHTAAWGGDVAIAEFLLEAGQDPNVSDDSGTTAMMVAILHLNLVTMRCVLRDGEAVRRNLVVDCREEQDERVQLVLAVVKLLVQFNGDLDARTIDGKTALHNSTGDDAYEVAKFLVDAGADIDASKKTALHYCSKKTALHYCVEEGGLLVTELLLSRGANIDREDKNGTSPLALVLQLANVNVLQLFLNHHQCVATSERHNFAADVLFQAVENGEEMVVRYVVENEYTSVVVHNEAGETPFHLAILRRNPPRNPPLMELLADLDSSGDNLTAVTTESKTPAHYAARYGSRQEVEVLLHCLTSVFGDLQELGPANPLDTVDQRGMTSLYIVGTAPSCKCIVNSADLGDASATESQQDRDAKAQLLLNHGARIFPRAVLEEKMTLQNSKARFIFPGTAQRCLQMWIVEDGICHDEPEDEETTEATRNVDLVEALTELCVQWMASVTCTGSWASLLPILICAGYAHEIVPLLAELPVRSAALSVLLRQLEKFARHQLRHPLLLQLHNELREVLQVLETTST